MLDIPTQNTLGSDERKSIALFDKGFSKKDANVDDKSNIRRQIDYKIPSHLDNAKSQYQLLCTLHFGGPIHDRDVESLNFLSKEITRKMNGYKQQDVKRDLYDSRNIITTHQIREKLIEDTMTCCFCNNHVRLLFDKVRDMRQWTLDRIDNNVGHSNENTKIACLKCNLDRRRQNYHSFHWTKNLCISKIEGE